MRGGKSCSGGGTRARARAGARRHDLVREKRYVQGLPRRECRRRARSRGCDLRDDARDDELGAGCRGGHALHMRASTRSGAPAGSPRPCDRSRELGDHARPGDPRGAVRAGGLDPRRRAAPGGAVGHARRSGRDAGVHRAGDLCRLRGHRPACDRGRQHAAGLRGCRASRRPPPTHGRFASTRRSSWLPSCGTGARTRRTAS